MRLSPDTVHEAEDFVGVTADAIASTTRIENPYEISLRRMNIESLLRQVQFEMMFPDRVNPDYLSRLLALSKRLSPLLAENFTRVVDGSKIVIFSPLLTNYAHYQATLGCGPSEQRTYMGLHTEPYLSSGPTMITAVIPRYHYQQFHAHRDTREYSLVIDPTRATVVMPDGNVQHEIAQMGQMIEFGPRSPHLISNPNFNDARHITVKLPSGQNDRVMLEDRDVLSRYMAEYRDSVFSVALRDPTEMVSTDQAREMVQQVVDSGYTYFFHLAEIQPGAVFEFRTQGAVHGATVGMIQIFPSDAFFDAQAMITGVGGSSLLIPDMFAAIPRSAQHFSLKNTSRAPVIASYVYVIEIPDSK